jgi:hypothetical protein
MAVKVTLHVDASGPLFDGEARAAALEVLDRSKREAADLAVNMLHGYVMNKTGRGTGHYQSEIQVSNLAYNDLLIHDPVVYSPWLEGVSRRNESTRFKGYHLWRRTRQRVRARAQEILQKNLDELIGRMGGHP